MNLKGIRAITLIALVITIILLLIIAGVTIATLQKLDLIKKTEQVANKYNEEAQRENVILNEIDDFLNGYGNGSNTGDTKVEPGTAADLNNKASDYIGASVNYGQGENGTDATRSVTWRIFDITSTNIYLIADDYINAERFAGEYNGITKSTLSVASTSSRDNLINFLSKSSNWTNFKIEGLTKSVTGGPTIEQYKSSYNKAYNGMEININGDDINGWGFKTDDGKISNTIAVDTTTNNVYTAKSNTASGYWLISPSGYYTRNLMVANKTSINNEKYSTNIRSSSINLLKI